MPRLTERWHAGWPGPGGHCAWMKALVVITAPLPRPPVPAFRDARPITRKLATCGAPAGSATVTRTVPPSRAPVARIVATPSMMSRSPRGRRPSTADSRAGPRTGVITTVRTCLAVDVDLDERAQRDLPDRMVPAQAGQQRPGDRRLGSGQPVAGEVGLERCAVQRGRGHQVRQAGAEHGGRAQRRHRHHRAEQRRAHRLPIPAPFERMPDPDQRGGRQAGHGPRPGPPPRPPEAPTARGDRAAAGHDAPRARPTPRSRRPARPARRAAGRRDRRTSCPATGTAIRASPTGVSGDTSTASSTAPAAPATPISSARSQGGRHELAGPHAQRRQGRVIGPLGTPPAGPSPAR